MTDIRIGQRGETVSCGRCGTTHHPLDLVAHLITPDRRCRNLRHLRCRDGCSLEELEIVRLREALAEFDATFNLRWDADMRAIKRWQKANPDRVLIWPDHVDLVLWLEAEVTRLGKVIERLTTALRVSDHKPHDQDGEPVEGFPACSICGAIQTLVGGSE